MNFRDMTDDELIKYLRDYAEHRAGEIADLTRAASIRIAILSGTDNIDFAIKTTNGKDNYSVGVRNGLRYAKFLIDGEEPQYEHCEEQEPWIPVSERLPEGLMIKTLVSCENDDGLPVCTMIAVYDGFKQKWDCDYRVKAWMCLPAPYKAESEGKNGTGN